MVKKDEAWQARSRWGARYVAKRADNAHGDPSRQAGDSLPASCGSRVNGTDSLASPTGTDSLIEPTGLHATAFGSALNNMVIMIVSI